MGVWVMMDMVLVAGGPVMAVDRVGIDVIVGCGVVVMIVIGEVLQRGLAERAWECSWRAH